MTRFILLTFGLLGFAWYEMSGGSDWEPGTLSQAPAVQVASLDETVVASEEPPFVAETAPVSPNPAAPAPVQIVQAALDVTPPPAAPEPGPVATEVAVELDAPTPPEAPVLVATRSEPEPTVAEPPSADLREVVRNRVNMRNGPGTDFAILAKLTEGDAVEVVDETGDGWLKVRVVASDRVGWLADWLVSSAN